MATILIVDDDRAVQEMLVDLLEERGYRVETCRDGSKALGYIESHEPAVVILDLLLPHVNGFKLIEQIRQNPETSELPVLMISGIYRGRNHRGKMMKQYGVLDYLDKPVSPDAILECVQNVVASPQAPAQSAKAPAAAPSTRRPTAPQLDPPDALIDDETRREQQQVESESRTEFKTSAFTAQGSVKKNPVAAILGQLWQERATGALLLRNEQVKKIIYVHQGTAYGVKSNLVSECLGQVLLRERLITEDELAESVRLMQSSGQHQGQILVEMRALTEKNLAFALDMQQETKLFETFTWESGEYRLNRSAPLPQPPASLEVSGPALIVEGIRRTYDETRLRRLMIPILDVPLQPRTDPLDLDTLGLTSAEVKGVRRAEFPQTTRVLLDSMGLPPPDALRVIYTLITLQLLGPS